MSLFIYRHKHLWILIFLKDVIHYCYFAVQVFPELAQRDLLQAGLGVLLLSPSHSLSTLLVSGTTRYSKLIVHFPCHCPEISLFSKKSWFLLVDSGRDQDGAPGVLIETNGSLFGGPQSRYTQVHREQKQKTS